MLYIIRNILYMCIIYALYIHMHYNENDQIQVYWMTWSCKFRFRKCKTIAKYASYLFIVS